MSAITITDAEYALALCDRIAAHTDVPGTITRTFLSAATRAVHELLTAEMHALGMTVRTDSVGNLRGLYAAETADAPVLLLGSHIDTVPNAGRYDGILGVAIPIALVRALNGKRFSFSIEIIAFSEEEGVRFKVPFLGSRALVGTLDAETLAHTDADGATVAEAIGSFGLDPGNLADAFLTPGTFAFLEAHIEQGPLLASYKQPLAIVEAVTGLTRWEIAFTGHANHAGTTPMAFRTDALAAAASWISSAETYARSTPGLVATVGSIRAYPGAANVIPGKVVVSLDLRHVSDDIRARSLSYLLNEAKSIAQSRCLGEAESETIRHVGVLSRELMSQSTVPMDGRLRGKLRTAVEAAGVEFSEMPSGAGHDAMIMAAKVPSAMLFIRTPGGLSHHPGESVMLPDVQAALGACMNFLEALTR